MATSRTRTSRTRKTTKDNAAYGQKIKALVDLYEFASQQEGFDELVEKATALFPQYSEKNATLILLQNKKAREVFSFTNWIARGRAPLAGKSVQILAPNERKVTEADPVTGDDVSRTRITGYHLAHVWDVKDTEPAREATTSRTEPSA
jgi:hypothetical protein